MDTDQIKTFLEVCRTRHFGHAAKNLFLSQSAVSSRIHTLESIVGQNLFIRNRNDIQLTPAGERLYRLAEGLLSSWNRTLQEVRLEGQSKASLSFAGLPSLWDIALQQWMHSLAKSRPDLVVHAQVLSTDAMIRSLLEGNLDIGFSFDAPQMAQLETRQIDSIPLILVSTSSGTTVGDALGTGFVAVDWGVSFSITLARHFPNLETASVANLPLGRIAREYLLTIGGSAYLAEPMIRDVLKSKRLFRVSDAPVIERTAFALFPSDTPRKEEIEQSLSLISF